MMNYNYINSCPNCLTDNELYRLSCKKCGSILHNKISNLNLWESLYRFLESPSETIISIIQAEKKNFVLFLFIAGIIKISFLKYLLTISINKNIPNFFSSFIYSLIPFLFFVFFIKIYSLIKHFKIRFKDVFAVFSYSLFMQALSLLIIIPIQFSFFGNSVLNFNPSPFDLKPTPAYFFLGLEVILLSFLIYYFYLIAKIFLDNKFLALVINLLFFSTLFLI